MMEGVFFVIFGVLGLAFSWHNEYLRVVLFMHFQR